MSGFTCCAKAKEKVAEMNLREILNEGSLSVFVFYKSICRKQFIIKILKRFDFDSQTRNKCAINLQIEAIESC